MPEATKPRSTAHHALVTGATGFIGPHLCQALIERGCTVTALVQPEEDPRHVAKLGIMIVRGDILEPHPWAIRIGQPDVVYHLAARTDLEGAALDDYRVNTEGTANVLDVAGKVNAARFVFYSSMLAVEPPRTDHPVDETYDQPPEHPYGISKREGERLVRSAPLSHTIIRPTQVYGPGERTTMQAFFRAVQQRRFVPIGRDVQQSFVYVKNLVEATIDAAASEGARNRTYYINDARPYSLREFAIAAAEALDVEPRSKAIPYPLAWLAAHVLGAYRQITGRPVPLFPSRLHNLTSNLVYSVGRAEREFGYRPRYDLHAGVKETAHWYARHGFESTT